MRQVESLRAVADSVGSAPADALRLRLDGILDFLARELIPHARAEDEALYPVVARVMRGPDAIETMRREHLEVGRLAEELGALRDRAGIRLEAEEANALRRVLYGLHALISSHFAKEESVYLALLDARLNPGEASDLFEAMERIARGARPGQPVT
jgi:iron-sulfur cluster repair protein YtfE (RIC family)